jgi:hypothetical protein
LEEKDTRTLLTGSFGNHDRPETAALDTLSSMTSQNIEGNRIAPNR